MSAADRQARIRATLDHLVDLVERASVTVAAEDFGDWLAVLDLPTFTAGWFTDEGTQVHAHEATHYRGRYVQLHCVCDGIRGHTLPGRDADWRWLTLPAAEAAALLPTAEVSQ